MKSFCKALGCLLAAVFMAGCTPMVTDAAVFALHYFDVGNMVPGEPITLAPSYKGAEPSGFVIYTIKHNGMIYFDPRISDELTPDSEFYIDPSSGQFTMRNTGKLAVGTYTVSIRCKSGGIEYDFPEKITVKIVKERQ